MIWLIVIVALLLLLGFAPLRRHAFGRHVSFTLPAIAGAGLGLVYGCWVQRHGAPIPGLPLLCAVIGALILGAAGKAALDSIFRGGNDR